MSTQRIVPPKGSTPSIVPILIVAAIVGVLAASGGYTAGLRAADERRIVMLSEPQGLRRVAFVRETRCQGEPCHTVWIGRTRDDASKVAQLSAVDRVEEIAWSADGYLVGFVVNGHQLRVFDPETLKPRTEVELIDADRRPSARIARGVTFSTNGAAVTFDDCPRYTSGCRSGLVAVR